MPTVTITHPDNSTETIDATVGYRWERAIGELFKLTVVVDRDAAQSVTLNRKEDDLDLAGVTTVRLVDYTTGGSTWSLIGYDFSWDGKLEEPTAGGFKESDTDDAIVTGIVNDIPVLSAGTINQVDGSIELTSNHAQPHERLRALEGKTSGEVRVNADKTLDYVDQLGSDKTGSITLSESNGNIEGEIRVQNRGRRIDATHVKVTGAHEGEAQFVANLVPTSDGRTYDNRINYSTTRWADSSDDDWDVWNAPEAASQSEVDSIAGQLADDLTETHIEAEATVTGEDLVLGDRVTVKKADADIDREMRVIRIVTRALGDTPADAVDEVTLSTHTTARDTPQRDRREQNEVAVAYEGNTVIGNASGGIQAVNSSLNYQLPVFYPDILFEHTVELYVKSIPYRAFSSGAAAGDDHTHDVTVTHPSHSHDVTHPSHDHDVTHPSHDHDVSATSTNNTEFSSTAVSATSVSTQTLTSGSWETVETLTPSSDTSVLFASLVLTNTVDSSLQDEVFDVRLENATTSTFFPDSGGSAMPVNTDNHLRWFTFDPTNTNGETLNIQVKQSLGSDYDIGYAVEWFGTGLHTHDVSDTSTAALGSTETSTTALGSTETSTTALGTNETETSTAESAHTHPVDPGVTEFGGETASSCDVKVDGTTAVTDIGSGQFETTVDLAGELTEGQFNDIEVTSDSLGMLLCTVAFESYRQIGTTSP